MLINKFTKKIVNFCGTSTDDFTNEVVVKCDGTKSVIEASDGRVGCQYTFHDVADTDGNWTKALPAKVWGQIMTQATTTSGIDVKDRSPTEFTFHPHPNPDSLTVTVTAAAPAKRPSLDDVTDTGKTTSARVDPKLLKKICDAAISAKCGAVTLKVPVDKSQAVVVRGATSAVGANGCELVFALAQIGE